MDFAELAQTLQERLDLALPPVALAFVDAPPEGVPHYVKMLPSACSFWRVGETEIVYAAAEDHFGCPIGTMVMGFPLPPLQAEELTRLVDEMCSISYLQEEEVANIPKMAKPAAGIVYGPLWRFPVEPDIVLTWVTPFQAMVLQEAAGAILWSGHPEGAVFGRPACAVLPVAVERGRAAMSLGCIGMRTYTKIPQELCLVSIPRVELPTLAEKLQRTAGANQRMEAFYRSRAGR